MLFMGLIPNELGILLYIHKIHFRRLVMYSGITISEHPRQIIGELHTSENAESYIEYTKNGTTIREEVFPESIKRVDSTPITQKQKDRWF